MNQINNPHDKFFKTVFSKKEAVQEFISKLLPNEFTQSIDLESLTLDNTEYIDEKLKVHCSDIVYNCQYQNNDKPIDVKISLLFEHKSYIEKYPHFQLLRYFVNVWEIQSKQQETLTPIIPIIFYHGKSSWNKKSFTDYFAEHDEILQNFLPIFDYLLLDIGKLDNQNFKQLNSLDLQISILLMKYIFNVDKLLADLAEIFANVDKLIATEDGRKAFSTMTLYLYQNTDLTIEDWREKMYNVSPRAEKQFVSTYDQAINAGLVQGREKGIKEGIQTGILTTAKQFKQLGIEPQIIAKATGLTLKEIAKL
ncbi:MAG: Rpn family recombination-promoting nuclease/putative transposase [Moraxellaceae bacterium]|nr:Rpn family recombination-promoting nuclease/putative transposase [Moraxellaceae bacterium]